MNKKRIWSLREAIKANEDGIPFVEQRMPGDSRLNIYWTGEFPCLCSGHWECWVDGMDMSGYLPFFCRPADTEMDVSHWDFTEDGAEIWYTTHDGKPMPDWIEFNREWLEKVAPSELWEDIYLAFQASDWRHGCCGGCI